MPAMVSNKSRVRCAVAGILASVLWVWSGSAMAEGMIVGVDGALVLPMGDWADVAGLGFGALGRFEYALDPQLSATGRVGYLVHLEKNDTYKTSELPILAGLRYGLSEGPDGLYLAGEAGLVNFTFRRPVASAVFGGAVSSDGEKKSDSELKFGVTAGAGIRSGNIDGRAGVFVVSVGDFEETLGIMATVGYNFANF
jgi:hypothetical protein